MRPVPLLQRVKPAPPPGPKPCGTAVQVSSRSRRRCFPLRQAQSNRWAGSATGPWRCATELRGTWTSIIRRSTMRGRASSRTAATPGRRTRDPLEQCAYWLDGLVRLGYILHDEQLIRKAKDRLNLVVDGVNRGGDSLLYWQTKPPKDFVAWAHSHMGRALVAWYEASGDQRILDALVKVYAQYPVPMGRLRFDAGDTYIVSGLCNIDAMLETYRLSGDRRILERVRAALVVAGSPDRLGRVDRREVHPRPRRLRLRANPPARPVLLGDRPAEMPGGFAAGFPLDR